MTKMVNFVLPGFMRKKSAFNSLHKNFKLLPSIKKYSLDAVSSQYYFKKVLDLQKNYKKSEELPHIVSQAPSCYQTQPLCSDRTPEGNRVSAQMADQV